MVKNFTKKKNKKSTGKKRKGIIKDVPLAKEKSRGSRASVGNIHYHYQDFSNTFRYFEILLKKNKMFRKLVCIPDISYSWMRGFLVQEFVKNDAHSYASIRPVDNNVHIGAFVKKIKECLKTHQIIPVNFAIETGEYGKHANMIILDSKYKTIEQFEPHGYHEDSQWSISRAYAKTGAGVIKFARKYFPDYTVISPKDYEPKNGLQGVIDAYGGMCVTWSILYLNYRMLNPGTSSKALVQHINKTIKRVHLLKFTRYVELILKKYPKFDLKVV